MVNSGSKRVPDGQSVRSNVDHAKVTVEIASKESIRKQKHGYSCTLTECFTPSACITLVPTWTVNQPEILECALLHQ